MGGCAGQEWLGVRQPQATEIARATKGAPPARTAAAADHELLEHILLVLLLRCGQPHLFLPLVVHHLLDSLAGLAVEVGELRVFWLDLLRIDLRVTDKHTLPPLHVILLLQRDVHNLVVLNRPEAVLRLDACVQLAIENHLLSLQPNRKLLLSDGHIELLGTCTLRHGHHHIHVCEGLCPSVLIRDPAVVDGSRALALTLALLPRRRSRVVARCCCRRCRGWLCRHGLIADLLEP
mmetsp:Transcript_18850/g.48582  ORF Transcript_18850/g.48582 Transcript_18850/m.48582 type:complete len:235 (+) Transcript_18850:284-988(+)